MHAAYNNTTWILHYITQSLSVRQHQATYFVKISDALIRNNLNAFVQRYASPFNRFILSIQKFDAFCKSSFLYDYVTLLYADERIQYLMLCFSVRFFSILPAGTC